MDFIKLIRSVEEFVYEICLWFLQVPKTFLKVIFKPKWVIPYVKEQLVKEEKKQFEEYLSPILFWVLIVVIPTFIVLKALSDGIGPENEIFKEILGESLQTKILVVATLLVVSPLTFAVGIHKRQKKTISRDSLKENFYIQVYVFAPLQFFTVSLLFEVKQGLNPTVADIMSIFNALLAISGFIYSWWFIYYEMYLIKTLLNTKWWKSFLWLVLLSFVAVFLTIFIVFFLMSMFLPDLEPK